MTPQIGFMQGRLSEPVNGKIQSFPWSEWKEEFPRAERIGLELMEWTLDQERLAENPLMHAAGRALIKSLASYHGVRVSSVTGDIFMQAPFWRASDPERRERLAHLDLVLEACASLEIRYLVVPLVDEASLQSRAEEEVVIEALLARRATLESAQLCIVFESDYPAVRLAEFIAQFPRSCFGINYDLGNSAALDYDCGEEIQAYGSRIANVHVKDRLKAGTTVPLGTGNANLPRALRLLMESAYKGSFILQTARAEDGDHARALACYRDLTARLLSAATV